MNSSKPDSLFGWGILVLLAFIWGSSFILMKIGLQELPFQELGALRMLLAFLFLLPFGLKNWRSIDSKYWKYLLVVGIFGNGAPAFLFAYAQTHINSSLAGMLNSLVPLFTLLLGLFFFNLTSRKSHFLGVFVGLIGAFLLLYKPGSLAGSETIYGFFVVLATICYAISVNVIKKYLHNIPSVQITSASLLFTGPICGIYLLFTDFPSRMSFNHDFMVSFGAVVLLSGLATGFAIIIFNMLIKRVSALYASSVTYLIPIVAVFWGLIDGESISYLQIAGMTSILTGIYIIQK